MPPRVGGLSPEGLWISPVALTGHSRAGAGPMCGPHKSQPEVAGGVGVGVGSTFWAHHSLRQAGPAFLPDHLSHHLCRPVQGRVDRMVRLSLRPGDLRLLSDTLILPDPQVTEAPGSGSH